MVETEFIVENEYGPYIDYNILFTMLSRHGITQEQFDIYMAEEERQVAELGAFHIGLVHQNTGLPENIVDIISDAETIFLSRYGLIQIFEDQLLLIMARLATMLENN